jgi:putative transcriptional regulator
VENGGWRRELQHTMKDVTYLDGQMLIAMPGIGDPRFERTVIFLCVHSADGAMGLVVNKATEQLTFPELLQRLDLLPHDERIGCRRRCCR